MVGKNKPHIDIFKFALNKANAKANESIMIGDDLLVDVVGAVQSGMQAILFDPNEKYKKSKNQQKIKNISELPYLLTTYN
jgi:putative hydrolase of the HAD superfamily